MIRIKNYIFNEKEIVSIEPISDGLRVDLKSKSDYIDIYATLDDIEWNYGEKENTDLIALKDYVRDNWGEEFNKNTTLKEMIERIILRYNRVEEDLQNEVDNYKDSIKEKYELEEENKTLKELNVCVGCNNNPDYK